MTDDRPPRARRLAAILHADVVGFSALMSADEAGTQAAVAVAMARGGAVTARHGGRVVGTAGDAFLAEFPSVVAAVSAAVEIQTPVDDAAPSAVRFRIGVNLGDVIVDGEDIFGEGVNVAARVQALAPPGGVAVTAAVIEQIGRRLDVAFEDRGAQSLKNIPAPVRIHVAEPPFRGRDEAPTTPGTARPADRWPRRRRALAAAGGLALLAAAGGLVVPVLLRDDAGGGSGVATPAADERPVVAVLPFADLGAEETYFADGFTEDVISHLGRFSEIVVLSWNAVAPFRGRAAELEALRRDLDARYVIGGSIRRSGDRFRISVQLVDARDGTLLWSDRYDAEGADLFALQDRIAGAAAGSLALGVSRLEQAAALDRPTAELDAYRLALQGRAAMRRVDREDNIRARDLFAAALRLDDSYADARAGLAWTHVNDLWWGWSEWPADTIATGEALAREALLDDPGNVPALTALSDLQWMKGDLEDARVTCRRAVKLNPNDARAHASCAGVEIFSGDLDSGVAHGELSIQLDPEPSSWLFTNLSIGYYFQRRYEDAAELLARAKTMVDEDPAPHAVLAAVNARLGRPEAARREVRETLRLQPFFDAEIFAGNLAATGHAGHLLEGLRAAGFD